MFLLFPSYPIDQFRCILCNLYYNISHSIHRYWKFISKIFHTKKDCFIIQYENHLKWQCEQDDGETNMMMGWNKCSLSVSATHPNFPIHMCRRLSRCQWHRQIVKKGAECSSFNGGAYITYYAVYRVLYILGIHSRPAHNQRTIGFLWLFFINCSVVVDPFNSHVSIIIMFDYDLWVISMTTIVQRDIFVSWNEISFITLLNA